MFICYLQKMEKEEIISLAQDVFLFKEALKNLTNTFVNTSSKYIDYRHNYSILIYGRVQQTPTPVDQTLLGLFGLLKYK